MSAPKAQLVTAVGPGDYVKVAGGHYLKIVSNTAFGAIRTPEHWTIITEGGRAFDERLSGAKLYVKADDVPRKRKECVR